MSIKRDTQPDHQGYIPLIGGGKLRAEYHPGRKKIRIAERGKTFYFDLSAYDEKSAGR